MTRELRNLIAPHVTATLEASGDETLTRDDVLIEVLAEFWRCNGVERYIRCDGLIGWRTSSKYREELEAWDADAFDEEML